VRNGGVLVLLGNDAPNCEFTHLNQLASRFGIIFNYVSLHQVIDKKWDMGAFTIFPDHPLFKGVKKIYMKEISSFTLSGQAKPILTENGQIFMAECKYGNGFVFAVGDPWIYNEYMDHERLPLDFDNRKAAENLTDYLLLQARESE
jgi:unsaturated rhamnogalacturonyl hydrolase